MVSCVLQLKHFEPIWGEPASMTHVEWTPPPAAPPKPARPAAKVKTPPTPPPPRLRTVGAVTRAVANYREKREAEENSFLLEPNKKVKSSSKPGTVYSSLKFIKWLRLGHSKVSTSKPICMGLTNTNNFVGLQDRWYLSSFDESYSS